ncbi:MAG TPA: mycofactocin biosynthesis peptidyl-dipeptidase MftE [Acidimicrobiales bacterium]|nr:mycofactocin biosynthesis peptidyl-dipeptidase MftE [Acidimicrobiales bacterium]
MTGPVELASATWPTIEAVAGDRTLLVPVGSTEQHGPHLPLDTDTRIARALAAGATDRLGDGVLVAPAVAYGASGEHADFTGTLSIGTDALTTVLVELGRSADAFRRVVFVNGHGGNADALASAVATLRSESRNALAWSWSLPGADAHAGRTETSLLLAIDPGVVRLEVAEAGRTEPITELLPALRAGGVRAVSSNGVLGDPTGASAREGRDLLAYLVDGLVDALGGVGVADTPS